MNGLPVLAALALAGALSTAATVASAATAGGTELVPVLRPSLDGFEAEVATLLTERLQQLEELLAAPDVAAAVAAEELGSLGSLYLAYSLPEAAESCLVNAARLAPAEFRWAYMLGTVRQERGDLEAARSNLKAAHDLDPEDRAVVLRLAQIEFELGALDASESLFRDVLEAPGFGAAVHYGLGRIAAARADLPVAIGHFEAALAAQPTASQVRYQLGIAYRRSGDVERAREQLASRGDGQLSFPDPVLEGLGQDALGVEVFLTTGRKARHAGDFDTAIAAFLQAIESDPENVEHRTVLGATLLEVGRFDEAVQIYSDALRMDPDSPAVLYNLAVGLIELARSGEAAAHLRRLLELAPDHVDGRVNLATLSEQAGELSNAEALLAEAIELDPYDIDLRVHRASVLISLGRAAEARGELRRVLDEDPGSAEALVVLGAANEALGSTGDAVAAWERALGLETDEETEARARYFLGRAQLQAGRPELAAEHLRAALSSLPESVQLRQLLAGALGAQGDFDGAAEQYGAVLAVDPADQNARFGRAISLLLAGRERDARDALEGWLTLSAEGVPLKHLLARLLATALDPELRDGARALRLAEEVFQAAPRLDHAETLAMAYAEIGRFDEALSWQQRIIERARASGETARIGQLEARRAQFERREAVRAPWSEGS